MGPLKFIFVLTIVFGAASADNLTYTANSNRTKKEDLAAASVYVGNDVNELMAICKNCTPGLLNCNCDIKKCCDTEGLVHIQTAQSRVSEFQKRLTSLFEGLVLLILWLGLFFYGVFMCCIGHWNIWILFDPYEPNPVEGLDYMFYKNEMDHWQLKSTRNEFTKDEIEFIMEEDARKQKQHSLVETEIRRY